MNPSDSLHDKPAASSLVAFPPDSSSGWLRRFFPVYCALVALATFGFALYDPFSIDGDAIAYMDIGDLLRAHQWAGIVNAYWHPMYPAFLSAGHILFHSSVANELHAYYMVNFAIFLMEMAAIVAFTDSIVRLRAVLASADSPSFLLDRITLRYLGLALLVIASQRELSIGKVRPDALLQALLLFALAALLTHFATGLVRYAALMGLALGCAYLTKSFAFIFSFLCIFALLAFRWLWLRHKPVSVLASAVVAFACFAIVAGPYVAALSHQKGRLDFGDSGALNYAWYVGGTEKMHLQPYQTSQFGSAEVHLKHPEKEILHSPQVLSYAEMPYGTYPDWFDTTYWNEQIKPHMNLRNEISRSARNLVLVVRYLFNHPEGWLLLALLLFTGARFTLGWKPARFFEQLPSANPFWLVPILLGVAIWTIYGVVNTEERYVTVAYLTILLTLFATLRPFRRDLSSRPEAAHLPAVAEKPATLASTLVLLLALLSVGESLRIVFEDRRQLSIRSIPAGWYDPTMFHIANALPSLGVHPGDQVACIGDHACLDNFYWARLAGVRILTEIYDQDTPVYQFLATMPNRDQAYSVVRSQGAKVIVSDFESARMPGNDPVSRDWRQLDDTTYYALPLN